MFREMKRNKQALSTEEIKRILEEGTSGVLALAGDDDYPYALPISYVYSDGKLYFHCAREGHKLDAIRRNPKASFCIIGQDKVSPSEYTTHYESVIAFGRIRIMEDEIQMLSAIRKISDKYCASEGEEHRERAISKEWKALCLLEMEIDHISGKQARELMMQRRGKN